jgi:hypothetical protein
MALSYPDQGNPINNDVNISLPMYSLYMQFILFLSYSNITYAHAAVPALSFLLFQINLVRYTCKCKLADNQIQI